MKKYQFIFFLLVILSLLSFIPLSSQEVPFSVKNSGVYDFLDELASSQIISINSAVKPYSRLYIAKRLKEADDKRDQLSPRQEKELDFYLLDFGKELEEGLQASGVRLQGGNVAKAKWLNGMIGRKSEKAEGREGMKRIDLFYYKDSLFSMTINPILGGELFTNSSGQATYWRNGAEARAYVQHWGFYASLRDNHEKPLLGLPGYLTKREGGHYKGNDWSDMQGGITYSWKWGNMGLVKDNAVWGNNYNGANIFGGNNPSFIQVRLNLNPVKWFTFNYFTGWLNSMVVDSATSYWLTNGYGTNYREKYHRKFMSANLFTFTPLKYLNISAGNSIIYDDSYINPAYLMPLFFYKSVDHSVSSGIDNMNSQMFFDISSRQIKNLHLYATLFVDELSLDRISKKDQWNFLSWKAGFRVSNYPVRDLSLTGEFTYTYPLTFQHYVPTLTFESNRYNLGHYLRDNAREWYAALDYKPVRTLDIRFYFCDAIRGPDYTELGTPRVGNPPLDSINWHSTSIGLSGTFQLINDLYVWASFVYSDVSGDVRWSPEYFYGKKKTFNLGITLGF
jgi:hypothetical protein